MPIVEAVQTFVCIANENECYSHHYLSEVFKGDIRERLEQWATAAEAHPEQRAPFKQLASWAGQWFALRNAGTRGGSATEQLDSFQHVQQELLQALGYTITPQHLELQAGRPVPSVLVDADFASIVSDGLFGADQAPRFIILVGLHEWLLLDPLQVAQQPRPAL